MKKLMLLCLILGMWVFGCGSETSGTLSVAAPTSSGDYVYAVASLTNANGKKMDGQPVNFTWYTVGVTTQIKSAELISTANTNPSGIASSQLGVTPPRGEDYRVYVRASAGDISNIEGWQSVLLLK